MDDPVLEARNQVNTCLAELQTALSNYWREAGEPPSFILEAAAPALPQGALKNAKLYADRDLLMQETLLEGAIVAEVGTLNGNWAARMLEQKSPAELHLFDKTFDRVRKDVRANPVVTEHQGHSWGEISKLPDSHFDWIYLDAAHDLQSVRRDRNASIPKLKPTGILVFNDYVHWSHMLAQPYGVVVAANEMAQSGWDVVGLAITPHGYWDIAFRRSGS